MTGTRAQDAGPFEVGYRLRAGGLGLTTAPASASATTGLGFRRFHSRPPFRFPRESAFGRFKHTM